LSVEGAAPIAFRLGAPLAGSEGMLSPSMRRWILAAAVSLMAGLAAVLLMMP